MKRSGPPTRRTPLNPVNRKRKAKRATEDQVYGSFHRWVKTHPCAIAGEHECIGPVDGHHLKSVGSGGVDAGNCVPLCRAAHTEIHTIGFERFNENYFNDLRLFAAHLWTAYRQGFDPE